MKHKKIRWNESEWELVVKAIPEVMLQNPGTSLIRVVTKTANSVLPIERQRPVHAIPPHIAQAIYVACSGHTSSKTSPTVQEDNSPVIEVETKVLTRAVAKVEEPEAVVYEVETSSEGAKITEKDDLALALLLHPDRYSIYAEVSSAIATEVLQERLHLGSANQLQALKNKPPTAIEWIASFMWLDLQRKKKETKPIVMILGMREHQWRSIVRSLGIHENLNDFVDHHLQLVLTPDSGNPKKEDYRSPYESIGQIYIAHGIPSTWFDLFYNDQSWDRSKVRVTTFREKDLVVEALKVINKQCENLWLKAGQNIEKLLHI